MIRSRFGPVVLLALALGLFALEVAAFASVANTTKRLRGARANAALGAARVTSRVLVGNAARGAEQLVAGAVTGLATRTTGLAALALGSARCTDAQSEVHARKMIRARLPARVMGGPGGPAPDFRAGATQLEGDGVPHRRAGGTSHASVDVQTMPPAPRGMSVPRIGILPRMPSKLIRPSRA